MVLHSCIDSQHNVDSLHNVDTLHDVDPSGDNLVQGRAYALRTSSKCLGAYEYMVCSTCKLREITFDGLQAVR